MAPSTNSFDTDSDINELPENNLIVTISCPLPPTKQLDLPNS